MVKRLLILGGTSEARLLADQAVSKFGNHLFVSTSLSGATKSPKRAAGSGRTGGFGGPDGLRNYLNENKIDFLIDATHPFASRISSHAADACSSSDVDRLVLRRPAWKAIPGDHWIEVDDAMAAASILPTFGRICFLTIGKRSVTSFSNILNMHFIVRMIEKLERPLPLSQYETIISNPPYKIEDDELLMKNKEVDVLVAKNAGGHGAYSKIAAARNLSIPIIMINRPLPPTGQIAKTVPEALSWLDNAILK